MSQSQQINFVVNQFNQELTLGISADIVQSFINLEGADCTVFYEVSKDQLREVFKFQTDSSDVDPDSAGNDVTYHIDQTQFPNVNVANASYIESKFGDTVTGLAINNPGPIATGFEENRSLLKHDFIRYLALKLFNTYHGVDLFNNEQELKDEIVRLGDTILSTIKNDLSIANNKTNAETGNDNIGYKLMKQIGHHDPDRFRTEVGYGILNTNGVQSIPLLNNDKLIFNVTINPAEGQNNLTGVNPIDSRTYRIVLILKDNVTNNTVTDD